MMKWIVASLSLAPRTPQKVKIAIITLVTVILIALVAVGNGGFTKFLGLSPVTIAEMIGDDFSADDLDFGLVSYEPSGQSTSFSFDKRNHPELFEAVKQLCSEATFKIYAKSDSMNTTNGGSCTYNLVTTDREDYQVTLFWSDAGNFLYYNGTQYRVVDGDDIVERLGESVDDARISITDVPEATTPDIVSVMNVRNDIGTTLSELKSQYPNGAFLVCLDGFPDRAAACYGEEGGGYAYYFFGGQSGDFEKAMDECEEQLKCAGFITTASTLFADMEDDMSLEDFFAFIGVDEYENLEDYTPITGWFKFMYRDMEVWLDTNELANSGEGDTAGKIVKRDAVVSVVDPEIESVNYDLVEAVMFQ